MYYLQKSVECKTIPNSSFCDGIIIDINTYNVIFSEKHMSFATINFHVVNGKQLKKKFGKVIGFFITKSFVLLTL